MRFSIISILCLSTLVLGSAVGCSIDDDSIAPTLIDVGALAVHESVDFETAHPYENYTDQSWTITAPEEAARITFTFDRFETESGYDTVEVLDRTGSRVGLYSGDHTGETVTVEGSYAHILFHSDYSITDWGIRITGYDYELPTGPTDHRPWCQAIGSRSEGWYWADTDELIRYERCADLDEPECGAIGSRSEGWYSNGDPGLIVWDNCRGTVGIAVVGETCGPSIDVSCFGLSYCQGIPEDRRGATGTCQPHGYCETDNDCTNVENEWIHPECVGHGYCDGGEQQCRWECSPIATGPWSWTTVLLRDVESAHPYANNYSNTWDVTRTGAEQIRVHFRQIEVEEGYDQLIFSGDREELAVMVDGTHSDYWTPAFGGDTLHIRLDTDYSVTQYGFFADMVSFYIQLLEGQCNRDEDCSGGEQCYVPSCFNPYAPCFGQCMRDEHCDDEQLIRCRMMIPNCESGTILAHQGGCYACVDPETCESPVTAGGEGDPCDDDRPCAEDLRCKAIGEDSVGECRDELWCDEETVETDCAAVIHPAVPGQWACGEDHRCSWVPTMSGGSWFSDEELSIPDNAPEGVISELFPAGLMPCDADVTLDVTINHTYRGDLVVGLTDPHGRRAVIHDRAGGGSDNLILEGFTVGGDLGIGGGNGTWTLDISDHAQYDAGELVHWGLHLRCR